MAESGLTNVSKDPFCSETILGYLGSPITPTESFYIRSHFSDVPELDPDTWRLQIEGLVRNPRNLSLDDLRRMPSKELVITLECAGNSRSYVNPPAEGLAFRHGAVGTARWKGVPLDAVLEKAGVLDSANEVLFEGADVGEEEEEGTKFDLPYSRSLPLERAIHQDTLLAYEMNGAALTPSHGYPVRLVVPGWFGMTSVKWLLKATVIDQPFEGFFQSRRYVMIDEGPEESLRREPVTTLKVKSLITHPRHGEVIGQGTYTIRGLAWTGDGVISKVEVSTDGGNIWREARQSGPAEPNRWLQWELDWSAAQPGHYILMARAADSEGNLQPASISWNFRGYANNSIHTIATEVPHSHPTPRS